MQINRIKLLKFIILGERIAILQNNKKLIVNINIQKGQILYSIY